jgi:hypothetical protein
VTAASTAALTAAARGPDIVGEWLRVRGRTLLGLLQTGTRFHQEVPKALPTQRSVCLPRASLNWHAA